MLLLDSQAVLWVLSGSPRLGRLARRMIDTSPAVHLSVASVWELTIKAMLGRLDIPAGLAGRAEEQGLAILPVTAEHAEALRDFPELARHDPFDRLLIAQASVGGLRLLTADAALLGLGRDFVVDATR